ncbi:MAG TPA: plasmid replication/partition related protein [Micromonosporaceae bacterium]|nr:plasmid replication/partition related protein [Micromonosporaceae bacterium]
MNRNYDVHPVAALFPMLAADELAELAADIKQRGLLHPVVLDGDGRILDGRNRMAACEMAGVEPEFITYEGDDPEGYALAVNIKRRNLTKGQQAMVAAKAGALFQSSQRALEKSLRLSDSRIAYAATVLAHAPDLVDAVIAGAMGLDKAYETARERKTAADSVENQLVRLRAEDSELAAKVVEGELSLRGAFAELAERQRKHAEEQRDARALLTRIVELAAPQGMSDGFGGTWAERLGDLDPDLTELIKRAEQAGQVLLDLAERVRQ